MFCISLANLRKWVKIPYNLLKVNCGFSGIASLKLHLFIQPHSEINQVDYLTQPAMRVRA